MKRKYGLLLSLILPSMVPTTAYAQLWSGIIARSIIPRIATLIRVGLSQSQG